MGSHAKTASALTGLILLFLGLAMAFWLDLWGRPAPPAPVPLVDPEFTNTATVRLSAAELIRTGGDTSALSCYACHDEKKAVELHLDADGKVILPEAHRDLVMRHGRNNRNDHCFNCHDAAKLDSLRTRDGRQLKIEESTQLCASCHGPTYRDWEAGIHGRLSGHWDRKRGAATRQDCTSCHDPHAPAFPPMKPGPGPHPRHGGARPEARESH